MFISRYSLFCFFSLICHPMRLFFCTLQNCADRVFFVFLYYATIEMKKYHRKAHGTCKKIGFKIKKEKIKILLRTPKNFLSI